MPRVYLDHAAAAPVMSEAVAEMQPYLQEHFGNPQSIHSLGNKPREAIERAREQVAGLINADAAGIMFTSSASEANNMAVKGLAAAIQNPKSKTQNPRRHIIVSAIEHQSVLRPARTVAKQDYELTVLPVDHHGMVSPTELERAIRPDTAIAAVMHANNEIGTVEPVAELARVCSSRGVLFHCDGTAAVGRLPVDVHALGVDSYAFSAQPFYGPRGAAALYLRTGLRLQPLIEGGVQERGRRAGTEDVAAIVGMGKAAEVAKNRVAEWSGRMSGLSRRLLDELPRRLEHIVATGHPTERLPGHVSLCVEFVEGEAMLLFLDDEGIAAASGSACTAKTLKASHVLLAIGLNHAVAQSSLMLTMGKDTTEDDVDYLLSRLPPVVERLRRMSPLYAKFKRGEDPYATRPGGHEHGHDEEEN